MNLIDAVKSCFSNHITFSGRATPREFWNFILFILLSTIVLTIINSVLFGPEITYGIHVDADGNQQGELYPVSWAYTDGWLGDIFGLIVLLPWLAVTWRRMHDSNRAGYLPFIPPLVLFVAIFAFVLLNMGPSAFWQAISTTGTATVESNGTGVFLILAFFGAIILNLYWLTRPSDAQDNRFGPPYQEAAS